MDIMKSPFSNVSPNLYPVRKVTSPSPINKYMHNEKSSAFLCFYSINISYIRIYTKYFNYIILMNFNERKNCLNILNSLCSRCAFLIRLFPYVYCTYFFCSFLWDRGGCTISRFRPSICFLVGWSRRIFSAVVSIAEARYVLYRCAKTIMVQSIVCC